ncbi:unnamed protein product [Brachionus calyciflorus]|uniref:Uncharacterized protein n=1 Tax=Brachionus calyciflorus TaxID=104777 RepID=A0A814AME5_9BILA|nr:unnamed protein product [Brachionus calyciflorus]
MFIIILLFIFFESIEGKCYEQCWKGFRDDLFCYTTSSTLQDDFPRLKNCFYSVDHTIRYVGLQSKSIDKNFKETLDFNFFGITVISFEIFDTFLFTLPNVSQLKIQRFKLLRTGLSKLLSSHSLPDTLISIDLSENSLDFIKSDFFTKFTNLKELYLSKNLFKEINLLIFNSNELDLIDFSDNSELNTFEEINFLLQPNENILYLNFQRCSLKKTPFLTNISKIFQINFANQYNKDFLNSSNSLLINKNNDKTFEIEHLVLSFDQLKPNKVLVEYLCFLNSNRLKTKIINFVDINDIKTLEKFNIDVKPYLDNETRPEVKTGTQIFHKIHENYTFNLFKAHKNYCMKYMLEISNQTTLDLKTTVLTRDSTKSIDSKITRLSNKQAIANAIFQNVTNHLNLKMIEKRNRILDYFMDYVDRVVLGLTIVFFSLLGIFYLAKLAIDKSLQVK